mmetsp:Transcript_50505/g.131232  ORF Transcript_50505/g.131232 Transcript_50505/m.131232 type:complete len:262 (+) Transcript_50505:926-1711(+)
MALAVRDGLDLVRTLVAAHGLAIAPELLRHGAQVVQRGGELRRARVQHPLPELQGPLEAAARLLHLAQHAVRAAERVQRPRQGRVLAAGPLERLHGREVAAQGLRVRAQRLPRAPQGAERGGERAVAVAARARGPAQGQRTLQALGGEPGRPTPQVQGAHEVQHVADLAAPRQGAARRAQGLLAALQGSHVPPLGEGRARCRVVPDQGLAAGEPEARQDEQLSLDLHAKRGLPVVPQGARRVHPQRKLAAELCRGRLWPQG